METPEDKNKDAQQPEDELQETPEGSTGNIFMSNELPEGDESKEDQAEEEPERLTGEISVVPVTPEPGRRRSWFGRLIYGLFSPDTRAGRFVRPFLRGLALFVGAFALGMLITYLAISQPMQAQLQSTQTELAATRQQLDQSQSALTTAQTNLDQRNSQVGALQQSVELGQDARPPAAAHHRRQERPAGPAQ